MRRSVENHGPAASRRHSTLPFREARCQKIAALLLATVTRSPWRGRGAVMCRGEIYQYVGDEIVITWVEAVGVVDARALRCYFAMRAALAADATRFVQHFGVHPELRAALHLGEVIAGEVGQVRRAIVFHGDVMNTTGRLEQATREVGCFFIASAQALASLGPSPEIRTRDLGALALRGRVEPIHAFCVEGSDRSA